MIKPHGNSNIRRLSVDGLTLVFTGSGKQDALKLIKRINKMIGPDKLYTTTESGELEESYDQKPNELAF